MKFYHIVFLFLLFKGVYSEPTSARNEFFLAYDLVDNLINEGTFGQSRILYSLENKEYLLSLERGSKDYMKILFEALQSNPGISFNKLYSEGDTMDNVIEKALQEEKTTKKGKVKLFKNGLNMRNLYNGDFRAYKRLIGEIINETHGLYGRTRDDSVLKNMNENLDKIRSNRFNAMKEYYKMNSLYDELVIDDDNFRFVDKNNNPVDLDKFNTDKGITKGPKMDNAHFSIIEKCNDETTNIKNILNSSC